MTATVKGVPIELASKPATDESTAYTRCGKARVETMDRGAMVDIRGAWNALGVVVDCRPSLQNNNVTSSAPEFIFRVKCTYRIDHRLFMFHF